MPEIEEMIIFHVMEVDSRHWITIRWQKDNRYYVAELMQALFGTLILKRTWDNIDAHRGQSKTLYAGND